MEHEVRLPVVHVALELRTALRRSDIGDESRHMGQRLDRVEVDTDNEGTLWHVLFRYLQPTTGSSTQIDDTPRL